MKAITANRVVRYRGTDLHTKGWQQEAVLRMLMNHLDPEVAEHPEEHVVYGGIGKTAREKGINIPMLDKGNDQ